MWSILTMDERSLLKTHNQIVQATHHDNPSSPLLCFKPSINQDHVTITEVLLSVIQVVAVRVVIAVACLADEVLVALVVVLKIQLLIGVDIPPGHSWRFHHNCSSTTIGSFPLRMCLIHRPNDPHRLLALASLVHIPRLLYPQPNSTPCFVNSPIVIRFFSTP